jgi:large subunit ribosomal protein L10
MTKQEKTGVVTELGEILNGASSIYFTDYKGLTVSQATDLRNKFREAGVKYRVAKNTLIKIALTEKGLDVDRLEETLTGQTALAFGFEDPAAPARILKEFNEKNADRPVYKMAWLDGTIYDGKQLKFLAALPTKKDLLGSIVGSLHAPITGIVGVLGALQRDIVYIMDAIEKKKAETTA